MSTEERAAMSDCAGTESLESRGSGFYIKRLRGISCHCMQSSSQLRLNVATAKPKNNASYACMLLTRRSVRKSYGLGAVSEIGNYFTKRGPYYYDKRGILRPY